MSGILVDPEDQDVLDAHDWRITKPRGYVVASRGREKLYLHIEIMRKHGLLEEGKEVDHRDTYGPKSDCRKSNLRMLTHGDNMRNSVEHPRWDDLPRCVYKSRGSGRYCAQVTYGNKAHHLGTYDTPEEASEAVTRFYLEKSNALK